MASTGFQGFLDSLQLYEQILLYELAIYVTGFANKGLTHACIDFKDTLCNSTCVLTYSI